MKMKPEQAIETLGAALRTGDRGKAVKLALELAERFTGDRGVMDACIDALVRCGETQSASRLSLAAARNGGTGEQFRHGRLLRETGQPRAAVSALEAAREEGYEPLTDVLLQLALAHADLRDEARSMELLDELLAIQPNHQLAQFNLATLQQAAGQVEAAERGFRHILERDPTFSEALARILYGRRMTAADSALLRRAEKRARSQITSPLEKEGLQFALAKAYDDLGDYGAAIEKARRANTLQSRRIGSYDANEIARFVDDMSRLVNPDWIDQPVTEADFEPVFIVGHFRSGSTLTEQVISGHPSTGSLGEVDFFLRRWFEDRQGFLELFKPGQDARLREIAGDYRELTETMGARGRRGIDKRPENLLFMGLLRKLFPGARFVHTRRNLLDNAISAYFQQLNDLSRFGTSLLDFHDYDSQCQRLMSLWMERFGEAIHAVDYEDLVESPEQTARALLEFLDLEWDPACLDLQSNRNFVRTASMAQVREGFHSRSVGRGRNYLPFLTHEERARFLED